MTQQQPTGFFFTIPVLPATADNNTNRPNLGAANSTLQNPNGQCSCWDLLVPVLHLLQRPIHVVGQLCTYHRLYLSRRIHLSQTHICSCHYQPDPKRCSTCGYCHDCGCDLITTSAPGVHRCSCSYCLARCCPHPPNFTAAKQAHNVHILLRYKQARKRCPIGARPTQEPVIPEEWPLEGIDTQQLDAHPTDDQVLSVPLNNRWPSTSQLTPTLVEEDRSATGLGGQRRLTHKRLALTLAEYNKRQQTASNTPRACISPVQAPDSQPTPGPVEADWTPPREQPLPPHVRLNNPRID